MQAVLLVVVFAAVLIGLFWIYRKSWIQQVLDFGITVMRYRYCLLLCIAPATLGILAWCQPYMLSAILVVRPGYFDIVVITMICFFAVGVGLAEMQLIRLNGTARFPNRQRLLAGDEEPTCPAKDAEVLPKAAVIQSQIGRPRTGWSCYRIASWCLLSLVLPGFCLANAVCDEQPIVAACFGVAIGTVLAMAVAFVVAALQRLVLGGVENTAESGILPFELVVPQGIKPLAIMHPWAVWLFGTAGKGFSKWMKGPGYTDEKGVLLAGQAQNLILIAFSAAVYTVNYAYGIWWDTGWTELNWPIAFYAVMLLFLVGFFLSGLAYWLDRFGLPPVVFAALYVVGCFWVGASDHYFEVDVKARRLQDHSSEVDADESNAYVVAARGPLLPESDLEQLYWSSVMEKWPLPEINGVKTLVVVTASGGGIQAAAWTTKVLTELDKELPGFGRSIGLISSVSGGSVGVMQYVGHRGPIDQPLTAETKDSINKLARERSLEAVSWGLAFPDFVRAIAPPAAPPLTDRAWALESWWWSQMGRKGNSGDRQAMQEVTIRDLIPLIKEYKIPPIVFNSTCVETGQRVLISPMHADIAPQPDSLDWPRVQGVDDRDERSRILDTTAHQLVSKPIDFLDFYDACLVGNRRDDPNAGTRANLRISTAARLSATFSYVTPVARPCPTQGFGLLPLIQRRMARPTNLEKRLHLHFCDGGYADNPGLVTAIRSLKDLLDYYQKNDLAAPFDQVLIVRIEPFPKTAAEVAKDNTGYTSAVYGPTAAMHATRVSTQAERGELEMRLLQAGAPNFHKQFASAQKAILRLSPPEIQEFSLPAESSQVVIQAKAMTNNFLQNTGVEPEDITRVIVEGIPATKSKMHQVYNEEIKSRRMLKGRAVPIMSVQFRFELYESPEGSHEKPQVITPPLTWTLTEKQKRAVDLAWESLKRPGRWEQVDLLETADTISPAQMSEIFIAK